MEQDAGNRVVVIGAGMGGLAAAIGLAVAGLRVTLVEAAAGPGGKMRSLPSPAGPADAGPTVLTLRAVFDAIFAAAGARLDERLTLVPQPILARHWWPDGATLDLMADTEETAAAVRAFAGPRGEAEFRRFDRLSAALYDAFDAPVMMSPRPQPGGILRATLARPRLWPVLLRPGATLAGLARASFTDARLRQLFGRYATYVGGDPRQSPAVLALVWQAEARGVWAVRGGMAQLAQALGELAAAQGVECRYGEAAAEIEVASGRVSAVRLGSGVRLRCAAAVFAGDPAALRAGLLGPGVAQAVPARATDPRSLSAWVWAFGSAPAGPRADALVHHNVFFGADPEREFAPIAAGAMPEDPTLYVCAQDRGGASDAASPRPPGTAERFEIIMNGPPRAPGSDREDDRCRARTFATLTQRGVYFTPAPEPTALTAPADFATMFPASHGSLYGRSPHGALATFSRPGPRTAIGGLYLAGGGAHPGAGVPMAALSGRHAAAAITTDLALPLRSRRTVMPGGMSTGYPKTGSAPSR